MPMFKWNIESVTVNENGDMVVGTQSIERYTLEDGSEHDAEHVIIIPFGAIGSRMAMYGLDTPEEAVDAILREHGCRLSDEIELPEYAVVAEDFGGTHKGVSVNHGEHKKTISKIVSHPVFSPVIEESFKHRKDQHRYIIAREGLQAAKARGRKAVATQNSLQTKLDRHNNPRSKFSLSETDLEALHQSLAEATREAELVKTVEDIEKRMEDRRIKQEAIKSLKS